MREARPEEMPILDELEVSFVAVEGSRHTASPRVGDVVQVRISSDGPEGLAVWDEACFVERLEEASTEGEYGAARINLTLEPILAPPEGDVS